MHSTYAVCSFSTLTGAVAGYFHESIEKSCYWGQKGHSKTSLKHHFLTPLQKAATHEQSKQHLKLLLKISESVDCLVCSDEDLRRNILTDFASIIWLIVSIHSYISS